jgi:hypothetical protein
MEYPCILKTESEIGGYKKFPPDYMAGRRKKQFNSIGSAAVLGGARFPRFAAGDGGWSRG